ncbi:hypothetical protein [Bordetella petrii]|uniref:hypothetical protein n=1 Tax=Bordetella petrii TaxID=94624 RepID=UPI00031D77B1|nr:hypothetical protein [Bordetella petrii]
MRNERLYENLADQLVRTAVDQIEPLAGEPISAKTRKAIAADLVASMQRHMPPLANLQAAG